MTLDYVEVHAANIFAPGQLGVAVGRAVTKDGLRIVNFRRSSIIKTPMKVQEFYTRPCKEPQDNLICCTTTPAQEQEELDIYSSEESEGSDFSESELDEIDSLISTANIPDMQPTVWPEDVNLPVLDTDNLIEKSFIEEPELDYQKKWNKVLEKLLGNPNVIYFVREHQLVIHRLLSEHLPGVITSGKQQEVSKWTTFYSNFHQYIESEKYQQHVSYLYQLEWPVPDVYKHVAMKLLQSVREQVLAHFSERQIQEQAEKLASQKSNPAASETMSAAGRGKVRYIAGRSVAKMRNKHMRKVHNNINKLDKASKECVSFSYKSTKLLEVLTATEVELEVSDDIASLEETSMRQNMRHGLTNITDKAQEFFLCLVNKLTELENIATLQLYGSELFGSVERQIHEDKDMYKKFAELFTYCPAIHGSDETYESTEETPVDLLDCQKDNCIISLFSDLTQSFFNVYHNQLRKNYLGHVHREKKTAHRKQIMKAKTTHKTMKPALCDIRIDNSAGKDVSHLQLKACVLQNKECFLDRLYTRADLIVLCKAYGLNFRVSDTKKILNERLVGQIVKLDKFVNTDVLKGTYSQTSSVSSEKSKSPTKRKSTSTTEHASSPQPGTSTQTSSGNAEETYCVVCGKQYYETEEWIGCDHCDGWFHRICAEITDDTEWDTINTSEESEWYCSACKKRKKE